MMIRRMTALAFVMLITRMGLMTARSERLIPANIEAMAGAMERMIDEASRSSSEHRERRAEMDSVGGAIRHMMYARYFMIWILRLEMAFVRYLARRSIRIASDHGSRTQDGCEASAPGEQSKWNLSMENRRHTAMIARHRGVPFWRHSFFGAPL